MQIETNLIPKSLIIHFVLSAAFVISVPCVADVTASSIDNPEPEAAPHDTAKHGDSPGRTSEEGGSTDWGIGLDVGILPGIKFRATHIFSNGFVLGPSMDFNTLLVMSSMSASAVIGWRFTSIFKFYITPGLGLLHEPNLTEVLSAPSKAFVAHLGAGIEWKIGSKFGLGLEGGMDTDFRKERKYTEETESGGVYSTTVKFTVPFGWLTVMFYLG